jgi:hypothetical protein
MSTVTEFQRHESEGEGLVKIDKGAGLKIDSQKSKIMRINVRTSEGTELGEAVEELDEICYLGSKVTKDEGADRCKQSY